MAKLVSEASPLSRWPVLAVNSALLPDDPVRAGKELFVVQCLALSQAQWGRCRRCRPRPQPAAESDGISHAAGAARSSFTWPGSRHGAGRSTDWLKTRSPASSGRGQSLHVGNENWRVQR